MCVVCIPHPIHPIPPTPTYATIPQDASNRFFSFILTGLPYSKQAPLRLRPIFSTLYFSISSHPVLSFTSYLGNLQLILYFLRFAPCHILDWATGNTGLHLGPVISIPSRLFPRLHLYTYIHHTHYFTYHGLGPVIRFVCPKLAWVFCFALLLLARQI
ncbi:hypothetical protein K445DRAFT_79553 [Daldinia sp. EC12]|nr:hypothetical protein K445DRAFT_79553 [Daldinia sp. EC12]